MKQKLPRTLIYLLGWLATVIFFSQPSLAQSNTAQSTASQFNISSPNHSLNNVSNIITVSNNLMGKTSLGDSFSPQATPDGKWIVFVSYAEDLVTNDNNQHSDIFIYNVETQKSEKISRGLNGADANGNSNSPSISDDGRFIVFRSKALNLVDENIYSQFPDPNPHIGTYWNQYQIFLYDRNTQTTQRISNLYHNILWYDLGDKSPRISGDGRYITYIQESSRANDIIIQYDRETGTPFFPDLSHCRQNGKIFSLNTSRNGRFITYTQGNGDWPSQIDPYISADLCLYDAQRQYSRSIYQQKQREIFDPLRYFSHPDISDNGRYITFETYKTNSFYGTDSLITHIYLGTVFLYDTTFSGLHTLYQDQGEHKWYTHDTWGEQLSDLDGNRNLAPSISHDGHFVLFTGSTPIDIGDQNQLGDAFIYEIAKKQLKRITHSVEGHAPNYQTQSALMLGSEQQVVVVSQASNLVSDDFNHSRDIFLINSQAQEHQPLASKLQLESGESISFHFPVGDDLNGYCFGLQTPEKAIYLFEPNSNQSLLALPANKEITSIPVFFDDLSIPHFTLPDAFSSGTYTLFSTPATNKSVNLSSITASDSTLIAKFQFNPLPLSQLESTNLAGDCTGTLSPDGQFTILGTYEGLVPEDTNSTHDYYICDTQTGGIKRISVNSQGQQFQGFSQGFSISSDSQWVAFGAYHLPDSDQKLYRYHVASDQSMQILPETNLGYLHDIEISGDGKSILFRTNRENIIENVMLESYGLFLWEEESNQVTLIADHTASEPLINDDGSTIVFSSSDNTLTEGVNESRWNWFIYDHNKSQYSLMTKNLKNISVPSSTPYFGQSYDTFYPRMSANGQVISYHIKSSNYSLNSNHVSYLAIYDRQTGANHLITIGDNEQFISGYHYQLNLDETGRFISFLSTQTYPLKEGLPAKQSGFFYYLLDRQFNHLSLLHVLPDYLDFSLYDDGYHYQLGDNQYILLNRPYINKKAFAPGDTIQISLPDEKPGYSQFVGLEHPNGTLAIYTSETSYFDYSGNELLPYQGARQLLNESIKLENWSPGTYKAYLLTLAKNATPLPLSDYFQSYDSMLGISLFTITSGFASSIKRSD